MAIARNISINNETYELEPSKGQRVYVGTCSTAAATNPKVCTVEDFPVDENGKPYKGTEIVVKFDATNTSTSTSPKLNVNGTGEISIWYNNAVLASAKSAYAGYAHRYLHYVYDGTYWVFMGHSVDNNSTYTNVALGQGYAVQNNSAASATITATLGSYALTANGIVSVKFLYDVPANATLNINSKGAKAIYNKNAAITSGVIKAGDTATFIYNTYYRLISVDRWQDKQDAISDLATIRSGAAAGATAIQQADLANVATSGSYNDLTDKPTIPAAVTVDSTITQNGTNPVQGGTIYSALDKKANIHGSVSELFNASTLQVYSNDKVEGVMMNAIYSDDEMRLRFMGSVDGGSLDYTFDGSGSAKTIATTADIASCVPTSRKINNKPLTTDITLTANDVGAVPTTRTVNGKALSSNITLSASDIGAMEKVILHFEYDEQNDEISFTDSGGYELTHAEVRSICNSDAYVFLFDDNAGLMLIPREELSNDSWAFTYGGGLYNLSVYLSWNLSNSCITCGSYDEEFGVTRFRTINNKELTNDITLTASDVGALPSNTHIPADQVQSNWNETDTSSKAYIQNKPTIPAAQVNSDWDASSGVAQILNKPTFKTINGESIVGTGDIEAGSGDVATAFTITITSTTIEVQPMTGAMMTVGTDVSFQVV